MRRLATVLVLTAACLLPGTAALADPAGPTNYRSTITSVKAVDGGGAVEGIELSVFGGDSFLVLTADPGVEVLVHGYAHDPDRGIADPYLRFNADGTVEANRRSPARWLNEDRYAAVEQPDFVDPAAPADWELVADGGSYAWHDHRIHWMSPGLPGTIDEAGGVQRVFPDEQSVPLRVGDVEVVAAIILEWEPSPSPLPWALVALVVAVAAWMVGRGAFGPLSAAVSAAAGLALAVGLGGATGLPSGVAWSLPPVVLPVVALGAALLARTRQGDTRHLVLAAAALPLVAWVVGQGGAFTRPIVPSVVPVAVIRGVAALVGGVALGAVAGALTRTFGGDPTSLADLADAEDA